MSSSSICSTILVNFKHKNSDLAFLVVNIYGPYSDRKSFWEDLVSTSVFCDPLLVAEHDLNFTLSLREVWGVHPMEEKKSDFFLCFLEKERLVDIEPVKLSPTWRNFRTGDEEVAKILDLFLVSKSLLNMDSNFRSGV
jgi:hypothetical protein